MAGARFSTERDTQRTNGAPRESTQAPGGGGRHLLLHWGTASPDGLAGRGARLLPLLMGCFLLAAGPLGCGAFREAVLARGEGNGLPLDFVDEDFRASGTASDLASSPYGLVSRHFDRARACYGSATPTGTLLDGTARAHAAFSRSLALLSPLPRAIPIPPRGNELKRARAAFLDTKRAPTPLTRAHEGPEASEDGLFTRVVTAWTPASQALGERLSAPLAAEGVKMEGVRVRSLFARSLEPDNEYQVLVQCADLNARLPDGEAARHTWPVYVARESGSLSSAPTQELVLRDRPNVAFDKAFSFSAPVVFATTSIRRTDSVRSESAQRQSFLRFETAATFEKDDGWLGTVQSSFYRESLRSHFMRYSAHGTLMREGGGEVRSVASFQHAFAKAAWESAPPPRAGAAAPAPTLRYLDSGCFPTKREADPTFLEGGLHGIDPKAAPGIVTAVHSYAPAVPSSLGETVCNALLED